MKLLYKKRRIFRTRTELLNFKINLSLAKLDMIGTSLVFLFNIFYLNFLVYYQNVSFLRNQQY